MRDVSRIEWSSAAIYARYSTDLQTDKSIDDQVKLCRDFAQRFSYHTTELNIYSDAAVSGASIYGRPSLQRLMEAAHRNEFKALIVENSSRLSRRSADLQSIFETLRFLGIPIFPVSAGGQPLDATTAAVHGLVDQLQREATANMVHRGMTGLVQNGRSAGGRCYGYKRTLEKGQLAIDADEAEIIKMIFASYIGGDTPRQIAARLNQMNVAPPRGARWSASTLVGSRDRHYGILQNELYAGVRVWNRVQMIKNPATGRRVSRVRPTEQWIRSDQPELRIIDEKTWKAAQVQRQERSIGPVHKTRKKTRVFSGLIRCGACGSGMGSRGKDTSGRVRIGCTRHSQSGDCPDPRTYYVDEIEDAVFQTLEAELSAPSFLETFVKSYRQELLRLSQIAPNERAAIERQLSKISAEIDRFTRLLGEGIGDVARLDAEIKSRLPEERRLKDQLAAMDTSPHKIALHPGILQAQLRAVRQLKTSLAAGESEAGKLIREVVDRIVLIPNGNIISRRDSPKPIIDIVGKLDALLESCGPSTDRSGKIDPVRGSVGSGGGSHIRCLTI
jgi:Site-specific recombinases, DNA invertase Pin homologs